LHGWMDAAVFSRARQVRLGAPRACQRGSPKVRPVSHVKGSAGVREFARIYKAMSDESRLRILVALADRGYGVCDLANALGLSQPTLSHHLMILRETGLVHAQRDGQSTWCTLNTDTFERYGI